MRDLRHFSRSQALYWFAIGTFGCGFGTEPTAPYGIESLEESIPSTRSASAQSSAELGFDIRLIRVEPTQHLHTRRSCDIAALGRVEAISEAAEGRYGDVDPVARVSVQCAAPTGRGWADLIAPVTASGTFHRLVPLTRISVEVLAAGGGYFDYPILLLRGVEGPSPPIPPRPNTSLGHPAFDLRDLGRGDYVGSEQTCSVTHVSDVELIEPSAARLYPSGLQNRMTVRCRHRTGDEWADLVFRPEAARAALSVVQGTQLRVLVLARAGGYASYPILQYVNMRAP